MSLHLIAPIVIPFFAAIIGMLPWPWATLRRGIFITGVAAQFFAALLLFSVVQRHGIQTMQVGAWPAPFGITLVADMLSAVMVLLVGLLGVTVGVYSLATIEERQESFGYYPLLLILLMGICGAFLTGDIFNLYVWFEVMLIASFVLMVLGGRRPQIEGGIKYVALNLMASAFFLAAVGILYGVAGTLNMADLAVKLRGPESVGVVTVVSTLFMLAFGIKSAAFPLFFWLPASYHTPPVAISAIFAGLLTKVGVYALIRVFTLIFVQDTGFTHGILLAVAAVTMVTGVLGAVAQTEFRRLLSFHVISQIGYLLMGLALFTPLALAGAVFFMIHVVTAKSALFLVSGITHRLRGTFDLKSLGGLYRDHPYLALLFLLPALSLAGVPPLGGFFAKLALVQSGIASTQYVIVAVALGVSILTLFSMTKIWAEAFWKSAPVDPTKEPPEAITRTGSSVGWGRYLEFTPLAVLSAISVALGIAAQPVFVVALKAAEELLSREAYIRAVLGDMP